MQKGNDKPTEKRTEETDTLEISGEDAAFILGSGGKTKSKLAQVSGANLSIKEDKGGKVILEINGTQDQRIRAKKYCKFVMVQRNRPVTLDPKDHPNDLTIVNIPYEAVSFVTGKGGKFLRMVEEEFGTLLFFLGSSGSPAKGARPTDVMQLAIFGDMRPRRGSELKIMTATEMKLKGHFTKGVKEFYSPDEGFSTDWITISEEDYSYVLGKGGSTRRKLSRASGCIVEYVGQVAYFAGSKRERECAREYLDWVLQQRIGAVTVDYANRDDCTFIMVPAPCIGYITGHRGVSLRQIEEETKTFCFFEGAVTDTAQRVPDDIENSKPLLIFGKPENRKNAEHLVWEKIIQKSGEDPYEDKGASRKGKGKGKGSGKGKGKKGEGKGGRFGEDENGYSNTEIPRRPEDSSMIVDPGETVGKTVINISGDDAAFVMGPQGRTKRKVAQASGTNVEIRSIGNQDRLTIEGTDKRRERAEMYIKLVMAQRQGPVHLDSEDIEDLTIVKVPGEAVSFVTGKQGSFLRLMEEEFGALLFFLDFNMSQHADQTERLAIFGPVRNRRGTELKVMAAIEMKCPGYYTTNVTDYEDPDEGFTTDMVMISEVDYSFALGRQGSTRKNIVRTTNCLVEYIGSVAFLSGMKAERKAAREYLLWLFEERKNKTNNADYKGSNGGYYNKYSNYSNYDKGGNGEAETNGTSKEASKPAAAPLPTPDEDDDGWGDWGGVQEDDSANVNGAVIAAREEDLLDLPAPLLDEEAWPDLGMLGAAPKKQGKKGPRRP
jgi:hypothetical protein